MRKVWQVIKWEFLIHFRSRTFLISTLFSPLLLSAMIFLPSLFIEEQDSSANIIGIVNFSNVNIDQPLDRELNKQFRLTNGSPKYFLVKIQIDSSGTFSEQHRKLLSLAQKRDSLSVAYNKVKAHREAIFKTRPSRKRTKRLKDSYQELVFLREQKDLSEFEYGNFSTHMDSLYREKIIETADQRLLVRQVDAYLLFPENILENSKCEYHSLFIGDKDVVNRFRKIIEGIVIDKRMEADRVSLNLRRKWLKEIDFELIQLTPGKEKKFDFYVNYFGPIIIVFLLFIAIFTNSGFLFSGILQEKASKIIEILASSVSSEQLMAGKILGLGTLGLFQVFVWMAMTLLMVIFKAMDLQQLSFINLNNAVLFFSYFVLGYFFFSSVYVAVAALFRNEKDAQQVNTFLRIIAIFPVLMAILVLNNPHSSLVQTLSFIPFLTPTFMILRVSLSMPSMAEILLSFAVMIISIILSIHVAGRIFRIGMMYDGEFPGFKTIWKWIR